MAHRRTWEVERAPMGREQVGRRRELRALREAFGRQLAERVRAIEQALEDTLATPVDRRRADVLFQLSHRLSGAASLYKYGRVYDAAAALECVAEALRDAGTAHAPAHLAHARRLVETLKGVAGLAAAPHAGYPQEAGAVACAAGPPRPSA